VLEKQSIITIIRALVLRTWMFKLWFGAFLQFGPGKCHNKNIGST